MSTVFAVLEEYGDRETALHAILRTEQEAKIYINERKIEGSRIEEYSLEPEDYKLSWQCFIYEDRCDSPTVQSDNIESSKRMVSCYGPPAPPNTFWGNLLIAHYQADTLEEAKAVAEKLRLEAVASGWPQEEIR